MAMDLSSKTRPDSLADKLKRSSQKLKKKNGINIKLHPIYSIFFFIIKKKKKKKSLKSLENQKNKTNEYKY